ncbi:hypothetical protein F441_17943 [Phytophthora nicotianae CJ01A1]|uniref:PX domain-containing protein n=1 Tax=Phytophthora nicotianae CJ01A1 TaxID=1317063 RepID=W2W4V5_PHYNI|nr:hypothetical protein F441_17943 [Phytophthora nicotianae CJ01A1]
MPRDNYNDFDFSISTSDTDTERTSEGSSLIKDLQLSQLSRAKVAVVLNSIHHVKMCKAKEGEHVTAYALEVFLQSTPKGIAKKNKCTTDDRSPDYSVEHRYSAFRTLRECISEAVKIPKDKSHARWCPYCSRVRELVHSSVLPPRFPSNSMTIATGLHDYLVRNREHRLEMFMNLLLRAAKDISYRSGCTPCGRFEIVSKLLNDFLADQHLQHPLSV